VRLGCTRTTLLTALVGFAWVTMGAQTWDAPKQARGWAKQDKDDSFTFHEPATRTLYTWTRDGGILGSLPTGKLEESPERWLLDPRNNAWVAHGTTLSQLDRTGKVTASFKLPAVVGDLCWDAKGFVLSYRTSEPYLEKRDYKGMILWSYGNKPSRSDGLQPQNRRPVIQDDAGKLYLADGNALNLAIFDGASGVRGSETGLSLASGQPAPYLEGVAVERGPLALWAGHNVVFAAIKASQLPAQVRGDLQGLALARLDLGRSRLEFLPTGLDESHVLVGVLEDDAIFSNPRGGLLQVKVK